METRLKLKHNRTVVKIKILFRELCYILTLKRFLAIEAIIMGSNVKTICQLYANEMDNHEEMDRFLES